MNLPATLAVRVLDMLEPDVIPAPRRGRPPRVAAHRLPPPRSQAEPIVMHRPKDERRELRVGYARSLRPRLLRAAEAGTIDVRRVVELERELRPLFERRVAVRASRSR